MPGRAVVCLTCMTTIQSQFRHDFVRCQCPSDSPTSIFVDGGNDYLRMGMGPKARWVFADDPRHIYEESA